MYAATEVDGLAIQNALFEDRKNHHVSPKLMVKIAN